MPRSTTRHPTPRVAGDPVTHTRSAWLRVVLGALLLAAVFAFADLHQLLDRLRAADPGWLLAGLTASCASTAASAWRWRAWARALGCSIDAGPALRCYVRALGLNALLPGAVVGGDVYRALVLRRSGQPTVAAGWSVLLDRISGLWMLAVLGAVGGAASAAVLGPAIGLSPNHLMASALALAGCLLALPALGVLGFAPVLKPLLEPLLRPLLGWLARRWPRGPTSWWLAAPHGGWLRLIWQQAGMSLVVQLLSATALACGGLATGVPLDAAAWAFAAAPIFLMAALPVGFGGWGTREAAAAIALSPFGVAPAAAVAVAVVYGLYGPVQALLGMVAFGPADASREAVGPSSG